MAGPQEGVAFQGPGSPSPGSGSVLFSVLFAVRLSAPVPKVRLRMRWRVSSESLTWVIGDPWYQWLWQTKSHGFDFNWGSLRTCKDSFSIFLQMHTHTNRHMQTHTHACALSYTHSPNPTLLKTNNYIRYGLTHPCFSGFSKRGLVLFYSFSNCLSSANLAPLRKTDLCKCDLTKGGLRPPHVVSIFSSP